VSRGIAVLFLGPRHFRWGWGGRLQAPAASTPGKEPVFILQEAGWAPGPVWTGGKSFPHRDSIPDRLARSQSLYRQSYPALSRLIFRGSLVQYFWMDKVRDHELRTLNYSRVDDERWRTKVTVTRFFSVKNVCGQMGFCGQFQWNSFAKIHEILCLDELMEDSLEFGCFYEDVYPVNWPWVKVNVLIENTRLAWCNFGADVLHNAAFSKLILRLEATWTIDHSAI